MNLQLTKETGPRQKMILISVLFAISIAGASYFLLIPTIDKIKLTNKQIANLKIKIINDQEKEKNIDQLTEKLNTIQPQIEKLDNIFIKTGQELEFIIAIEKIAEQNNIIQTIDIQSSIVDKKNTAFKQTPLEINAKGAVNSIYNYLSDMESMGYYYSIEEFSLNSITLPGEDKKQVNLHLLGTTYWN